MSHKVSNRRGQASGCSSDLIRRDLSFDSSVSIKPSCVNNNEAVNVLGELLEAAKWRRQVLGKWAPVPASWRDEELVLARALRAARRAQARPEPAGKRRNLQGKGALDPTHLYIPPKSEIPPCPIKPSSRPCFNMTISTGQTSPTFTLKAGFLTCRKIGQLCQEAIDATAIG